MAAISLQQPAVHLFEGALKLAHLVQCRAQCRSIALFVFWQQQLLAMVALTSDTKVLASLEEAEKVQRVPLAVELSE